MILTIEEREIFFDSWLKLLSFANDKYNIVPDFGHPNNPVGLDVNDIIKIKNKIWENRSIIDVYLKKSKLDEDDYNIVNSWKQFVQGKFLIVKELSKYCIFLDIKNENLYGVYGISNKISDATHQIPVIVEAVLIPLKSKIIYDSVLIQDNVSFGPNMKKSFNEEYKTIKEKQGIKTNLLNT